MQQHSSVYQGYLITCAYCQDYKSTPEDVTANHLSVCGCYPVECPNKCDAVLQRQNIESHVAKNCPLTVIQCDFHYAGCEVRLPCKDMREHLMFKVADHLSLLAVSHQQLVASHHRQIYSHPQQIAVRHQQQVASHHRQIYSHPQQIAVSHQQHQQQVASYTLQQDQDRQRIDKLVKENEALKQRVTELEKEQKTDRALIKIVHDSIPPVDTIMPNFEQHKTKKDTWYSPPFYTHHRGYKLCLNCYAIGFDSTQGSHVSVYILLMRGEFDDELKWPFRCQVTIQLLSQDGSNEHRTKTITLDDPGCYSRIKKGDRGRYGQGESRFISHDDCYSQYYIKNDSLSFKIVEVTLK